MLGKKRKEKGWINGNNINKRERMGEYIRIIVILGEKEKGNYRDNKGKKGQ